MKKITRGNASTRRNVVSELEAELLKSNFDIELYLGSGLKFTSQNIDQTKISYLEKIDAWKVPLYPAGTPLPEIFSYQNQENKLSEIDRQSIDERLHYLQLLERVFTEDRITQIKEYMRASHEVTSRRIEAYDKTWETVMKAEQFINIDKELLKQGRVMNILTFGLFRRWRSQEIYQELDNYMEPYIGWKAVREEAKKISIAIDDDAQVISDRIKPPHESKKLERVADLYLYISNEAGYHTKKLELLLEHAIPFYSKIGRITTPKIEQIYESLANRLK